MADLSACLLQAEHTAQSSKTPKTAIFPYSPQTPAGEYQAEVALLSRRILFTSDDASPATTLGPHTTFFTNDARVVGAAYERWGARNKPGARPAGERRAAGGRGALEIENSGCVRAAANACGVCGRARHAAAAATDATAGSKPTAGKYSLHFHLAGEAPNSYLRNNAVYNSNWWAVLLRRPEHAWQPPHCRAALAGCLSHCSASSTARTHTARDRARLPSFPNLNKTTVQALHHDPRHQRGDALRQRGLQRPRPL